ncbi:MAG TPA: hypothetical protein VM221_06050 [Armatimonadota bacterium]|nr:hypothetical protein [Armatimonadota bacterium]
MATPDQSEAAAETVTDAREAAQLIMDLAGFGAIAPQFPEDKSVRAWLITRRTTDGGAFHAVGMRIFGYRSGDKLPNTRNGKAIKAAICAAAAECHETGFALEVE